MNIINMKSPFPKSAKSIVTENGILRFLIVEVDNLSIDYYNMPVIDSV